MPRLRRSDPAAPGIVRQRCGAGFTYRDAEGNRIDDAQTRERIRALAIPPAWQDVWICPHPMGHLQAVGTDQAGRRQYLYHAAWRARREQEKWDRVLAFAEALPALRIRVDEDLARGTELTRSRVLACAARLLDRGLFRIGSEQYAEENHTYGLATVRREHVTIDGDVLIFDYPAKHGKQRIQRIMDPEVVHLVRRLLARRSGGPELLAWRDGRSWVDVRSIDINDYVKEAVGGLECSAKDFRSWHGTVLAAVALAVTAQADRLRSQQAPTSGLAVAAAGPSKRKVARAVQEVARYLGNTPAVCRASYIDPRVIDRYLAGSTIEPAMHLLDNLAAIEPPESQLAIETAVLELLGGRSERTIRTAVRRTLAEVGAVA